MLVFHKGRNNDSGNVGRSASPLCLERSGTYPARSCAEAHGGQGGHLRQSARFHQRKILPEQPVTVTTSVDKEVLRMSFIQASVEPLTWSLTTSFSPNWSDGFHGHIQRVVINGSESHQALVTSAVPQGSVLDSELFNTFINDTDRGSK